MEEILSLMKLNHAADKIFYFDSRKASYDAFLIFMQFVILNPGKQSAGYTFRNL